MATATRNKVFYEVNLAEETIVPVASKPEGNALITLIKIHQLLEHNTRVYIRTNAFQTDTDFAPLEERAPAHLAHLLTDINLVVKKIMNQYIKAYNSKRCCLLKLVDRVKSFLGFDTPLTRMESMHSRIQSELQKMCRMQSISSKIQSEDLQKMRSPRTEDIHSRNLSIENDGEDLAPNERITKSTERADKPGHFILEVE